MLSGKIEDDLPVAKGDGSRKVLECQLHIMHGKHNRRRTLLDQLKYTSCLMRIDGRDRLISQQDLAISENSAPHGDALLLTTRQGLHTVVCLVRHDV